jgi:hypothetical protein
VEALERYGEEWQFLTVDLVEAERAKSGQLLKEQVPSLPPPPDQQIRQHGGTREADEGL